MGNRPQFHYMRLMVIVHGKSELHLCNYIKNNLRLMIEVIGDKDGEKSIQINSLTSYLNNSLFSDIRRFVARYPVEQTKGNKIRNFQLFTIMDTDDCTPEQLQAYKDKSIFKKHWLRDYIVPIYNTGNLEDVLKRANWPCPDKKKDYCRVFPVKRGEHDIEQVRMFCESMYRVRSISNLHLFIQSCIDQHELFN